MLTAFVRAFQTPDLRKKMLITLGLIALFRFGSSLPTPGIDEKNVAYCSNVATTGAAPRPASSASSTCSAANALLHLSVFALGIMPYITASIILQLLTVVIPRLETLKKEGQAGQAKITQYTRYLTVGLAILQSTGYIELARSARCSRVRDGGRQPAHPERRRSSPSPPWSSPWWRAPRSSCGWAS
jgi:preprotein translocase subunit SecY